MHDDGVGLGQRQPGGGQAVVAGVLGWRGEQGLAQPLQLHAQNHDYVGIPQGVFQPGVHGDAGGELLKVFRHQRRRTGQRDACAEFAQQVNVGAGHAAVENVAQDSYSQTLQPAFVVPHGERVQQGLGGMFVGAVAGVQDGHSGVAREEVRNAGALVADHQRVGAHGNQRLHGVEQRFALLHAGGFQRQVHHVHTQPLGRHLEGDARAGGGLEERQHQRLAAQQVEPGHRPDCARGAGLVFLGSGQDQLNVFRGQRLDAQQVSAR